jgi:hypothetical protein
VPREEIAVSFSPSWTPRPSRNLKAAAALEDMIASHVLEMAAIEWLKRGEARRKKR